MRENLPKEKKTKYYNDFYHNLINGINYYRTLPGVAITQRQQFNRSLDNAEKELNQLNLQSINLNQSMAAAH